MKATLHHLLTVARWIFGPAALVFLGFAALRSRAIFATVIAGARVWLIIVAAALLASVHLLAPVFSRLSLRGLGIDIPYTVLLSIHTRRLPTRYLPGGIWHTVSRAADIHRLDVSRAQVSTMVLLESLVHAGVALMAGGVLLLISRGASFPALPAMVAGALATVGIFLGLRLRSSPDGSRFKPVAFIRLVGCSAAIWTVTAGAFTCYWLALPEASTGTPILQVAGSYLLAWTAGFVNVFAPQGIGVFEATIGALLDNRLPLASVAVLAAGIRAVTLVADGLAFGAFGLIRHRRRGAQVH